MTGSGARLVGEALGATFENEFKAIARGAVEPASRGADDLRDGRRDLEVPPPRGAPATGAAAAASSTTRPTATAPPAPGRSSTSRPAGCSTRSRTSATSCSAPARRRSIAGRCSVFAKSDMIHAQQKGYAPPEVLRGLCDAVVAQLPGQRSPRAKIVQPPVAFIGGVAANKGVVQALREAFDFEDGSLFVPRAPRLHAARSGAALLEAAAGEARAASRRRSSTRHARAAPPTSRSPSRSAWRASCCCATARPYECPPTAARRRLPGHRHRVRLDQPRRDRRRRPRDQGDLRPRPRAGRSRSSTPASQRSAANSGDRIVDPRRGHHRLRPRAHRRAGGRRHGQRRDHRPQDRAPTARQPPHGRARSTPSSRSAGRIPSSSRLENGVVVDFTMNEACAAGTGSFLEEQAEKLGIGIKGEFARLALRSAGADPAGRALHGVHGARREGLPAARRETGPTLVAGLAYSIVLQLPQPRGARAARSATCIFFQGGTAYNDAVAAAFASILGKQIIVPPHNGVIGAIGTALLARERSWRRTGAARRSAATTSSRSTTRSRDFTCKGCSNDCDMQEFTIEGQKTYWGDKCSDRFRKPRQGRRGAGDRGPRRAAARAAARAVPRRRQKVAAGAADGRASRGPCTSTTAARSGRRYFAELRSAAGALQRRDQTIARRPARADRGRAVLPDSRRPRARRWLPAQRASTTSSCPTAERGDRDPDVATRTPVPGARRCRSSCAAPASRARATSILIPDRCISSSAATWWSGTCARRCGGWACRAGAATRRSDAAYAAQRVPAALMEAGAARPRGSRDRRARHRAGRTALQPPRPGLNMNLPRKLRKFYGVNVIPLDFLPSRASTSPTSCPTCTGTTGARSSQTARFVGDAPEPAPHLHHELQVRPRLVHQALRARGLGQAVPHACSSTSTERRRPMTRCEAYLDSKGLLRWWSRDDEAATRDGGAEVPLGSC